MKKILFLIYSISKKGGTERVASMLANFFSKKNNEVYIACFDTEITPAFQIEKNIEIIKLEKENFSNQIKSINITLKSIKPDIVMVHNMGKLAVLTAFLPWPKKSKFYSLEHVSFASNPFYVKTLKYILYRRYNGIISLTSKDENIYKKFSKITQTIPNFTPYENNLNIYNPDTKNIIAVGRFTKQKGFDLLVKAWEIAQPKINEWHLTIIGEGPDKKNIQDLIIKNKIKNINLLPPQNNIQDFYKNSSFFVLSSRFEGLPMVLIEAQSFSLPLISFDCPTGPSEIIKNNENGFLIKPFDIYELSEKIIFLANSPQKRLEFSKNSFKNSKKFTKNEIFPKWENLIDD